MHDVAHDACNVSMTHLLIAIMVDPPSLRRPEPAPTVNSRACQLIQRRPECALFFEGGVETFDERHGRAPRWPPVLAPVVGVTEEVQGVEPDAVFRHLLLEVRLHCQKGLDDDGQEEIDQQEEEENDLKTDSVWVLNLAKSFQ